MGERQRSEPSAAAPVIVGRYAIFDAIAAGGMATVHLGRLVGPAGFSRTVAIKRLHAQFAHDPDFTAMFLDEARLAARVTHPNVVPTLDVVQIENELLLVMEYVRGEALSRLMRAARHRGERIPPRIAIAILSGALQGLHAAHEALDEKGRPLGLVHRDMSPQNILVGVDGTARVLDFGVAKAEGRIATTREGQIKGKILYMPPEQLAGKAVTRTADIYSVGVTLFEALTGARMFGGEEESAAIGRIMQNDVRLPSAVAPELVAFDPIVRRATSAEPEHRYPSAREMSLDLERVMTAASPAEVGEWVERVASSVLDDRARRVAEIESSTMSAARPVAPSMSDRSGVQPKVGGSPRLPLALALGAGVVALLGASIAIAYSLGARRVQPEPAIVVSKPAEPPPSSAPVVTAATAQASAPPPATTSAPAADKPKITPAATAVTRAAKPSCDPPYTVDKNGHKHFIPECVR